MIYDVNITGGSLEVKLPIIWTDERQRCKRKGQRRGEKRREEKRREGKGREEKRREENNCDHH